MVRVFSSLCLTLLLGLAACAPATTSVDHAVHKGEDLVRAAKAEGTLSIYANTDASEVAAVLDAFKVRYPGIAIDYADQNSTELYSRFIAETAAHQGTADLVWSSAMDLQIKLINDGYAQSYVSAEKDAIPEWAVWKDQGYGVTAEPIVIAYNKRLLSPDRAPHSHADLRRMLEADPKAFKAKIGTYDPERSGVGFLYYSQDRLASAESMDLYRAIGATSPKLYTSTGALMERVASGEHLIAYNMIGSYALERQRKDPTLGVIFPSDYTLVMSRIAFVSADARHPNAAKLFLDFLLSRQGQDLLAKRSLQPVRTDLNGGGVQRPAVDAARPIEVGPALLANLDEMRRLRLLMDWRDAVHGR
jgi:iron(III) transport system substrate-binding protein